MRLLSLCALASLLLTGCTATYYVHVRTFPPTDSAQVLLDGAPKATTSDGGQARFTESRSIFAQPNLEIRDGAHHGRIVLRYAEPLVSVENVAMGLKRAVMNDLYVDVVFAMMPIPLPPPQEFVTGGRNTLSIRNPTGGAVWVAYRKGNAGNNVILFENATESVAVPDGTYDIYLVFADDLDDLRVMRQRVHLGGHGGFVRIPLREERAALTDRVGDPSRLGEPLGQ